LLNWGSWVDFYSLFPEGPEGSVFLSITHHYNKKLSTLFSFRSLFDEKKLFRQSLKSKSKFNTLNIEKAKQNFPQLTESRLWTAESLNSQAWYCAFVTYLFRSVLIHSLHVPKESNTSNTPLLLNKTIQCFPGPEDSPQTDNFTYRLTPVAGWIVIAGRMAWSGYPRESFLGSSQHYLGWPI
jgi:hypothetical protein